MSEFKDAIKEIAKENGIELTESNYFGLSDDEYAQQLAQSREEDREENAAMYDHTFAITPRKIKKPKSKEQRNQEEYNKFVNKINNLKNNLANIDIDQLDGEVMINTTAEKLNKILNLVRKKSVTNDKLKALIDDSVRLEEGDKKIFDKDTGYNISEDENFYYELIKKKWPDVERSKTFEDFRNPKNHRPWQVDFYVPSENMMIQINKNWRHGRRPYNPEDPDCQSDVEWLKAHDGDYYKKVLYTWTELEPLKRKIAKELGYKYVEIFNMDEFIDWYKNPELTYEEYKHPVKLQYDSDEYFAQKARGRDIYGCDSNPND